MASTRRGRVSSHVGITRIAQNHLAALCQFSRVCRAHHRDRQSHADNSMISGEADSRKSAVRFPIAVSRKSFEHAIKFDAAVAQSAANSGCAKKPSLAVMTKREMRLRWPIDVEAQIPYGLGLGQHFWAWHESALSVR
jgi:hypothetical protein